MTRCYINMGTKQLEQQIKKTAAHRQIVMMRKQKKERNDAKVTLDEMRTDKSPGKITSHQKITALIAKFGKGGLPSTYQKAELHIRSEILNSNEEGSRKPVG